MEPHPPRRDLAPLLHPDEKTAVNLATAALETFPARYHEHWLAGMRQKLGLLNAEPADDSLANTLLDCLHRTRADYTNTFVSLAHFAGPFATAPIPAGPSSSDPADSLAANDPLATDPEFSRWREAWHARLARQPLSPEESAELRRAANPAVIPRNHLVEAALAAAEQGDLAPLDRLLEVIARPYDHAFAAPEYRAPAPDTHPPYQTFCGT
jgi:uncharacterized protein YdiU (UPF0061 family)